MKNLSTNYSAIAEEIRHYHNLIIRESIHDLQIKKLYKGCQILFSPLIFKPKYLLIGFNPGGGYYNWHGKIVEEFEPMPALEYYLNKHTLGEQTKTLFKMAGREDELQNSAVKINFYPWATDNVANFNELMRLLPKELSADLFHNSRVWTTQLIEILKPKTIVCEGIKAFDEIQVLFTDKTKISEEENFRSFQTLNGIKIIGYKRNQGSILDKESISDKLKFKITSNHNK